MGVNHVGSAGQSPISVLLSLPASLTGVLFVPVLYASLASIGLLLSIWRRGDIHQDSLFTPSTTHPESYDFIVVGSGSAGSVVANRLSKHYNVLLLEAGGEPMPLQSIPGFVPFLINYPETDWMHRSVPQRRASLNSINQQSSWSAGKTLGGSGTLNLLLYLRGHPNDYNNWARLVGDESWNYENVMPFFKKQEAFADPKGDPRYHGFKGELSVELPDYQGLGEEFVQAGEELGYPRIDVNEPHTEGFFKLYHTSKKGVRHSSYGAFIQPIRNRKMLTIRKHSLVTKILFDENNREVTGVLYDRFGQTYVATVEKELIISAGAITTPKLLMLSGIGPKEHLEEIGIPVRHDLPVGKNLQDHTAAWMNPFFVDAPRTIFLDRDVNPGAFVNWFTTGKGVLGSSGAHAAAVLSSSYAKARGEGDWPDIVIYLYGLGGHKTLFSDFAKTFYLKSDELNKYYEHAVGKDSFFMVISGARPYARGYIKLGGPSPYDELVIDPNYLNDHHDLDIKVMVEGARFALHLCENTTSFQKLGTRFTTVPLPGCEHLPFRSDEYLECYIRRYTITLHHPVGTAAMGPPGSPHTVVDTELRVQGVKNLRVVDASVVPIIIVTNTQAVAMMVGEKGADLILNHWKPHKHVSYSPNNFWGKR